MPIFEFACRGCSHEFEKLVATATTKVRCPLCGGANVAKKFSVFGAKSGGKFTPSSGGTGCSSCSKSSCTSCH